MTTFIDRVFKVTESGSSVRTELIGGSTTFFTMSYVVFVQPVILSAAGMDYGAVMTATCVASSIAIILIGITTNYPIAIAPAMGHNIFFTYTVCLAVEAGGMGFTLRSLLC